MYLHLGKNTVVPTASVLGVFDLDNSTVSKNTRDFLTKAQKESRVVDVSAELPKSFIVCMEQDGYRIYLSQIAPSTLLRRAETGMWEESFLEEP